MGPRLLYIIYSAVLAISCLFANSHASEDIKLEVFSSPFNRPWAMVWLPDETALITERRGQLHLISNLGKRIIQVQGVPKVSAVGQGGLLDVQLHPDFANNKRVYLCYSKTSSVGIVSSVGYGQLIEGRLDNFKAIFAANAGGNKGHHFGCRIRFDDTARIFVAIGERGVSKQAQNPSLHPGSILALTDEGEPHPMNPNKPGWAAEVYAIGIRNPQGMLWHQPTGQLFVHEHGPQGGDELNLILPGANYGWPIVSYGEQYGGGKVGEGQRKQGIKDPLLYWTPSIAPSGLMLYEGFAFPQWRNSFFIGSLKFKRLLRVEKKADGYIQETIVSSAPGRIRDVVAGPDGYIYIIFDERNIPIYRLRPS